MAWENEKRCAHFTSPVAAGKLKFFETGGNFASARMFRQRSTATDAMGHNFDDLSTYLRLRNNKARDGLRLHGGLW